MQVNNVNCPRSLDLSEKSVDLLLGATTHLNHGATLSVSHIFTAVKNQSELEVFLQC